MPGCTLGGPGRHLQLFLVPPPQTYLSFPGREGAAEEGSAEPEPPCPTQRGSSAFAFCVCGLLFYFLSLGLAMTFMYIKCLPICEASPL